MFTCISLNLYYIEMFYMKSWILMASVFHVVLSFFWYNDLCPENW